MIYDKGKNNKTNYLNLMEPQRIPIYNTQRRKIAIVREAMSQVQLKMVDVYITPDGRSYQFRYRYEHIREGLRIREIEKKIEERGGIR